MTKSIYNLVIFLIFTQECTLKYIETSVTVKIQSNKVKV